MNPGEVYFADYGPAGTRPVIVVSRENLNRGERVVVVPCTTVKYESRKAYPNCVPFSQGQFGFTSVCVAQCEAINMLYKSDLDLTQGPSGSSTKKLSATSFAQSATLSMPSASRPNTPSPESLP
jgi:mRNA-degrading endonuclease toxin of MazEF toxin-antitoxin module